MNTESQTRLLRAVYACLRPLARLLLRSGVAFKTFEEIAKAAFVHEALLERDSKGRLTNTSRVAVRTGLSRKEVRRISEEALTTARGETVRMGHFGTPARALDAWHSDSRFVDSSGLPKDLPFEGGVHSFSDVVRAAGGDVPPGAVRAELIRAAAVLELENGHLRPTKRYFVPGDFDEKAITILSGILFPMIAGVDHNANPNRTSGGFIQRFAFAPLPEHRRAEFREWSREEATQFIEMINDRLNRDKIPPEDAGERDLISGVGVFFYEGLSADSLPKPEQEG
ncbi:MAG TPA: DUF6502 family protein [Steroidobacteraceae bacterium]|nr:DUF6502 family protein [Steroidobacteraceae bacterium]